MSHRPTARIAGLIFTAVLGAGCGDPATLAGSWDGSVSCGDAGGVDLAFEVEGGGKGDTYDVDGLISDLTLDGVTSDVELTGTWTQAQEEGPQVIDVAVECLVIQEDAEFEMPCSGFDELGWDGADLLEATVVNFLESELDCGLSLAR